nr:unnamed protein product [Callosobruchus analis]
MDKKNRCVLSPSGYFDTFLVAVEEFLANVKFSTKLRVAEKKYKQAIKTAKIQANDNFILSANNQSKAVWTLVSYHFLGVQARERRAVTKHNIVKVKLFLRYVGNRDQSLQNPYFCKLCPGFQRGLEEGIGVHQISVTKIVKQIVEKVIK